jgi:hypothetical protein
MICSKKGTHASLPRTPLPSIPSPFWLDWLYIKHTAAILRASNVHIINTKGLPLMDLYPCVECWCRDYPDWLKKMIEVAPKNDSNAIGSQLSNITVNGQMRVQAVSSAEERLQSDRYRGGTACCKPEQCPSTLPPETTTYHLQYNITYRWVMCGYNLIRVLGPAHLYLVLRFCCVQYFLLSQPCFSFLDPSLISPFVPRFFLHFQ